jgi:hypothetical protein
MHITIRRKTNNSKIQNITINKSIKILINILKNTKTNQSTNK